VPDLGASWHKKSGESLTVANKLFAAEHLSIQFSSSRYYVCSSFMAKPIPGMGR